MSTGTMLDGLHNARTLKYLNSNAVAAGAVIVVNGQVLVATKAYGANATGVYVYRGKALLPKEASLAVAPGEVCYWVAANGNVNKTESGNTKLGICVEAAATTDTTVIVMLDENK